MGRRMAMTAPTILTQEQLNALGQRLLALTPGGSEYFSKHGDGFKVDVDACMTAIEQRRHDALKYAKDNAGAELRGYARGVADSAAIITHAAAAAAIRASAGHKNHRYSDAEKESERAQALYAEANRINALTSIAGGAR